MSQKTKIGLVGPFPLRQRDGNCLAPMELYLSDLVDHLQGGAPQRSLELHVFTEKKNESPFRVKQGGGWIHVVPCYSPGLLSMPKLLYRLWREKFDVVHIQHETFLYGGPFTLILLPVVLCLLRLRSRVVLTLHHVVPREKITKEFADMYHTRIPLFLIRFVFNCFYKAVGVFANGLIVHEEARRECLVFDYGLRGSMIQVIPHGIRLPSTERKNPLPLFRKMKRPKNVFGFFGFIEKSKGIDFLIDEFAVYAKRNPDSMLIIAGAEHQRLKQKPQFRHFVDALKRKAASLKHGRVLWLGMIPESDIPRYLATLDCLVLPYRHFKGGSSVLSWAISTGTPFLVSDEFRNTVTNDTLRFSRKKNSLSSALASIRTQQYRAVLQAVNQQFRREHSWSEVTRRTKNLYWTVLEEVKHRLLIVGAYGQGNIGDECLLSTCLSVLPRKACTVASSNPSATELDHFVRSIPTHGNPLQMLFEIFRSDSIIVGGGDQFKMLKPSMRRTPYNLLTSFRLLSIAARLFGTKLILLGVGIGNVDTKRAKSLTKRILNSSFYVSFRSTDSMRLASLITTTANTHMAADLTFLSHSDVANKKTQHALRIGIAPTFHVDDPAFRPTIMNAIARSARTALSRFPDTTITLLPFQKQHGDPHDDLATCKQLAALIGHPKNVYIATSIDFRNVHHMIGDLDILWGMRLHSLIFAVQEHVPFVALQYDIKIKQFMNECGLQELNVDLQNGLTANDILTVHTKVLTQKKKFGKKLKHIDSLLRRRMTQDRSILQTLARHAI